MNTHDIHPDGPDQALPAALRWQLRALRGDVAPSQDLWPAIAARLPSQPVPVRRSRPWRVPAALAATLVLALGVAGVWRGAGGDVDSARPVTLVQREADGMQRHYQAAIQEMAPTQTPAVLQPAFDELDRNATLILDALAHDPNSRLLLEQLRRTYARRLALTQRIAYT
ncbi:hypothetical protein ACFOLC_07955 [Lysobacter cavernae]|uniref:Anti-sigma factor n=1 Tax=Lysobacter cavernae TaxID=1685901 RepID=A0ABV7RQF6_9GAMM